MPTSTILLVASAVLTMGGNRWGSESLAAGLCCIFLAVVGAIAALANPDKAPRPVREFSRRAGYRARLLLLGVILVHVAIAVLYCRSVPATDIDCFTFQRDAMHSLLHGTNPYGTTQANIYPAAESSQFYGPGMIRNGRVLVGLQYPPLTLGWILPGYLAGDLRYSYVLAVVLAAIWTFSLTPSPAGLYGALFLLLNPVTFLVENRAWTEPLVLMLLVAVVYTAVKKPAWLPVVLGLLLASKQYNILALPLIGLLIPGGGLLSYAKLTGKALAVAAVTTLPLACLNPRGMWHDLVLFHLAQPFRMDAISFAVAYPPLLKFGFLAVLVFLAWSALRLRGPAMFAAAYGLAVILFFATSKQAFCNYYFVAGQALLLAATALGSTGQRAESGISRETGTATEAFTPTSRGRIALC